MEASVQLKTHRSKATQNRLIALSNPLRAEVLRILVERPASPVEIARELGASTQNVSHHAKKLVELDCAELVEEIKVQGAVQHVYKATERALIDTDEWEQMNPVEAQGFLAEVIQLVLDDFQASQRALLIGADSDFHLTRTPTMLDQHGLVEALEILERARHEVLEVQRKSVERDGAEKMQSFPLSLFIGLFKVPPQETLSNR
jgi:DNA-binding transcriptional ArsR family regulator